MRYLLAALILFSANVYADSLVARDQLGNAITLMDEQCVAAPWLKDWKTASFLYEGKVYAACWKLMDTTVVVLDSEGMVSPIPVNAFKMEAGA